MRQIPISPVPTISETGCIEVLTPDVNEYLKGLPRIGAANVGDVIGLAVRTDSACNLFAKANAISVTTAFDYATMASYTDYGGRNYTSLDPVEFSVQSIPLTDGGLHPSLSAELSAYLALAFQELANGLIELLLEYVVEKTGLVSDFGLEVFITREHVLVFSRGRSWLSYDWEKETRLLPDQLSEEQIGSRFQVVILGHFCKQNPDRSSGEAAWLATAILNYSEDNSENWIRFVAT